MAFLIGVVVGGTLGAVGMGIIASGSYEKGWADAQEEDEE